MPDILGGEGWDAPYLAGRLSWLAPDEDDLGPSSEDWLDLADSRVVTDDLSRNDCLLRLPRVNSSSLSLVMTSATPPSLLQPNRKENKTNKKKIYIYICIAHWFTSLSTLARYDEPGLNLVLRIFILHCYQVRPHSSVLR